MIKLKTEPREHRMIPMGLSPEILLGLIVADGCAVDCGWAGVRLTSGTDGRHNPKSKHYRGDAVDMTLWSRSNDRPERGAYEPFVGRLQARLGPDYDVVLEQVGDPPTVWVHLEYDPKGR